MFLQDHTLRVLRLDDHIPVYTLHGHCSPVTSAFIDSSETSCAGSGSQNGMLCVWDLFTGACVYSIQAHDGAVLSLTYSPSYVVSMGGDDKLCVWERVQGHLINSISLVSFTYTNISQPLFRFQHTIWEKKISDPSSLSKLLKNCTFLWEFCIQKVQS